MNSAFDYYHSILIPISDKIIMSLDVKISEAIMYFQENGYAIKEKVFERCGKPNPITQISKRPRRSAVPDFMDDIIFDDNVPKEAINPAIVPPVPRYSAPAPYSYVWAYVSRGPPRGGDHPPP